MYVNRKKGRMDIGYIKNATPDFELLEAKCDEWIRWHEIKNKLLIEGLKHRSRR